MRKIFCLIDLHQDRDGGHGSYEVADLTNVFRNTPVPSISTESIEHWEYRKLGDEIQVGQLFYFSKIVSPGTMTIKVEPIKFSEYKSMLRGFELFMKSGNSSNHSNSLRNQTYNLMNRFYDSFVIRELRDEKINMIINEDKTCS
jgi:hypothetical protein